jgi:hypothetical protein
MIKCNISKRSGEKIYHLPFDQQYDKVKIVNDTLKLSHLPRSMFKKRGVKVSHC